MTGFLAIFATLYYSISITLFYQLMKTYQHKISLVLATGVIILITAIGARSQGVEFGLRFMPAFTKFDINTSSGNTIKGDIDLGYGVGALLGFHFSENVGI